MATITTHEWDLFLKQLALEPNVTKAARAAGLLPSACYSRRERDADFRREWDEAMAEAVDGIEAEIHRRAVRGVEKGIWYQGERVGEEQVYSDSLLSLYAKRWIPEYRDRQTVDMNASVKHEALTEADREKAVAEILAKAYARMAAAGQEHGPVAPAPEDFDLG